MRLDELELRPDRLQVVVFGPGFGESIAVWLPPGDFLVVDSLRRQCRGADVNPAHSLLEARDADAAAIALTHPHADHALGLAQLLDRRVPGSPVGCLKTFLPRDSSWRTDPDAAAVLGEASLRTALNRIDHIWATEPGARWPLRRGPRTIGAAEVEVLHPASAPAEPPRDLNRMSSPMLIRWERCAVVLGADLPVAGWRAVQREHPAARTLAGADLLKASHHGSRGAQHPVALGTPPPRERPVIVTPFNKGHQLPNYADGHGIEALLQTTTAIEVTAAAAPHRGTRTPRAQMNPPQTSFGDLVLSYEPAPPSPHDAWVSVAFDASGALVDVQRGSAAAVVVA